MKAVISSLVLACAAGASQLVFCQPAPAIPDSEVINQIEKEYWAKENLHSSMQTALEITLYIALPDRYYLTKLDENRLKQVGCEYKTGDPKLIADLIKTIDDSDLQGENFSLQNFEYREAIYLHTSNDKKIAIKFGRAYENYPKLLGLADGRKIAAKKSLLEDLYRFAAKLDPVRKCEYFIGRFRGK
ncbi:hypothetical protein [Cupriavidus basilensis]|uniref:hypothetical protein n=1 Tax=Cupriavidus basilensis TaxID=68895 RepID=UPI0011869682|nr:hypothetical protein [Cupriavidus basilensis]